MFYYHLFSILRSTTECYIASYVLLGFKCNHLSILSRLTTDKSTLTKEVLFGSVKYRGDRKQRTVGRRKSFCVCFSSPTFREKGIAYRSGFLDSAYLLGPGEMSSTLF